jgi:hypothetical protein
MADVAGADTVNSITIARYQTAITGNTRHQTAVTVNTRHQTAKTGNIRRQQMENSSR